MKVWFAGVLAGLFAAEALANAIVIEKLPPLDQSVSNNAVTLVSTGGDAYLYSFLGLGSGKTWQDTSSAATALNLSAKSWQELPPVPGTAGRLAASAVTAANFAWIFGGYIVGKDGSEKSTPGVFRVGPGESKLKWMTDMPVPVEDSVVLAHQDRYVYLVSGWHDLGNVNLVQVLDTTTLEWSQATPWPGAPVFGHAGGISDGKVLICDGVRIQYPASGAAREFLPSDECWLGRIDEKNHRRIHWQPIPVHPGQSRYRMASSGDEKHRIVFAGGSTNPYNFNGVGYNGVPARPESSVFSYNLETEAWQLHGDLPFGTMDHRGLPLFEGWFYVIGGMRDHQKVVSEVFRFRLDPVSK